MSSADARGFRYTLQAPMMRRQWTIDRLLGQIAAARGDQRRLRNEVDQAVRLRDAQASQARSSWIASADPTAHRTMLAYLADLRGRLAGLQQQLERADARVRRLEASLAHAQVRLNVLEQHRDGQRDDFDRLARSAAERDADAQWLTLRRWRGGIGPGGDA